MKESSIQLILRSKGWRQQFGAQGRTLDFILSVMGQGCSVELGFRQKDMFIFEIGSSLGIRC